MGVARKKITLCVLVALAFVVLEGVCLKNQRQSFGFYNEFSAEARIEAVIDDVTIILAGGEKVRYLGINAPEIMVREGVQWIPKAQIFGEEAKLYN
jgi:hypothetical protein